MYGETFYGRHTAQHQLQWSLLSSYIATLYWSTFAITHYIIQKMEKKYC